MNGFPFPKHLRASFPIARKGRILVYVDKYLRAEKKKILHAIKACAN
jgi:hypothetical protein